MCITCTICVYNVYYLCVLQEKGNCPLHVAAGSGQILQIELLIIYGADPGALDAFGKTPIEYAT